ncbi:MAG: 16S rRNA (cytidine(1402)-2'-O)-methyltransferase [Myxococcaceae bacterium]
MPGTLFLVATPIGNLGDVSARSRECLERVDFVIAEDTRRTRAFLTHLGLSKSLLALPGFDEARRVAPLVRRLSDGESAALVSDAGSPGISDPGEALVRAAVDAAVPVQVVPGPSAVIAALSGSGLPTARFHFLGFLPRKGTEREALLDEVASLSATLVIYESPRRVAETLAELAELFGEREACVARELTKLHETFDRGTLPALAARYADSEVLGEIVLVIEGRSREEIWPEAEVRAAVEKGVADGARLKELAREIAQQAGWKTADVYRLGLKSSDSPTGQS